MVLGRGWLLTQCRHSRSFLDVAAGSFGKPKARPSGRTVRHGEFDRIELKWRKLRTTKTCRRAWTRTIPIAPSGFGLHGAPMARSCFGIIQTHSPQVSKNRQRPLQSTRPTPGRLSHHGLTLSSSLCRLQWLNRDIKGGANEHGKAHTDNPMVPDWNSRPHRAVHRFRRLVGYVREYHAE